MKAGRTILIGEKTMLTWPYASVAQQLRLPEREEVLMRNLVSPFRSSVPGCAPTVLKAKINESIRL